MENKIVVVLVWLKSSFFLSVEQGYCYKFAVCASNNKKATMSLSKPRISDVDIAELDFSIFFGGKNHKISVLRTCYGDYLANSTHVAMVSCAADEKPASDHFYKTIQKCAVLKHGGVKLRDQLKVLMAIILLSKLNTISYR